MPRFFLLLVIRSITRRFGRLAIAFVGVALGIAALVALEAVMEGVGDAMVINTVAIHHGHVNATWESTDEPSLQSEDTKDGYKILKRRILDGVLTRHEAEAAVRIYGVEPEREAKSTIISSKMVHGEYIGKPGTILLGREAAERLNADVGDAVALNSRNRESLPLVVGGIYRTGIKHLDSQTAFMLYAETPLGLHEVAVFVEPDADLEKVRGFLRERLPENAEIATWEEALREVVQLTALNHVAMNIVQLLALVILAFGVSNTVFISVTERTRELGILRAMGMSRGEIQVLIVTEALALVVMAGLLGIAIGGVVCHVVAATGIDLSAWTSENPHFLASGVIHPRATMRSYLLPLAVACVCGCIAALLPAHRAARIKTVEALRVI